MELEAQDCLVSFDVTNLFTQGPVDEALQVIEERLSANNSLIEKTSIPVLQLTEIIEICLRTTYFQFQETFYEQLNGAAMGSPLSPVVANLYMEHLEEKALRSAPAPPRLWIRYVDDTFVVWPHGQEKLDCFQEHLNMQHSNIKFTVEHERENMLAFLDVQVTRNNNRLTTSVYRKPTHTNRYMPFHSHHHQRTITGVLRCMRDGANKICDSASKQQEFQHHPAVFQANGFPADLVRRTLSHQTRSRTPPEAMHEDPAEPPEDRLHTLHPRSQ